ncbi:phage integrase family site specific recombinase [Yersinia kristensenii]|nr:phage integrase family site specific recombinase [Yersinia kristensenii]
MAKLKDIQIRAWIKAGEHFAGRSDGAGCIYASLRITRYPSGVFAIALRANSGQWS